MTAQQFRHLALSMPEAVEQAHMAHPDFRVRGKIFATLGPDEDWAMLKLNAEQQSLFLRSEPRVYRPASGAWGLRGATIVELAAADESSVRQAVTIAWRNTAPKKLVAEFEGD